MSKEKKINELIRIITKETVSRDKDNFVLLGTLSLYMFKFVLSLDNKENKITPDNMYKYLKRPIELYENKISHNDGEKLHDDPMIDMFLKFKRCLDRNYQIEDVYIKKTFKLLNNEVILNKEETKLMFLGMIKTIKTIFQNDPNIQYKFDVLGVNTILSEIEDNYVVVLKIMKKFDEIHNLDIFDLMEIFMQTKGINKKLQDHFTPIHVGQILAQISLSKPNDKNEIVISDPCVGCGNLLIPSFIAHKEAYPNSRIICVGQDLSEDFAFFTEMLLELINKGNNVFYVGDSLTKPHQNRTTDVNYSHFTPSLLKKEEKKNLKVKNKNKTASNAA